MEHTEYNSVDVDEIIRMEQRWNAAIQARDVAAMDGFLASSYFLAIGVQSMPLQVAPKDVWLATLPFYEVAQFSIDDIQVHVYGDTAVALMLYTQKAMVRGGDRSGELVITDIWIRTSEGWRVAERHSSRPEQPALTRPDTTT